MKKDIILFTNEIEKAKEEIIDLGGHVTQQFTKHVFIANLPDKVDSKKLRKSTPKRPSDLDEVSDLVSEAWESSQKKPTAQAPSKSEGLSWDAPGYEPPSFIKNDDQNSTLKIRSSEVEGSSHTPTSRYMIGSISVGLVIVSGTDSNLEFSTAERLKIINEVQKGLNFLANAEPRAKITFRYDIRLITVTARPGATSSHETAESPWRNAALQQMGFGASRQGSIDYVNQLKRNNNTDWAYVAYFTKYPLGHFAYAGAERVVMHYYNDGWGVDNINKVFAHETCHIFGAADEYVDSGCRCDSIHGHLGIQNKNCKNCDGNHEICLMDANTLQLCKWSRKQIGWDESLYPRALGTAFRINDNWRNMPEGFKGGYDAAINGDGPRDGKCYFFKGNKYIRFDWNNDKVDPGYPKLIKDHWKGFPISFTNGIDAAMNGQGTSVKGKNECYFFKGREYIRFDWKSDKVDPGYPKLISANWHYLPSRYTSDFNATLEGRKRNIGKVYLFKGDFYIRYNWAGDYAEK